MEHQKNGLRRGSWTEEEDMLLRKCVEKYGEGKWHQVPLRAGLNRCRKSCRLRWMNYLRPNIKRGQFAPDEVDLISRMHKLLGNRWALIAGRLPGRTANDIKNFWNTHLNKKAVLKHGGSTNNSEGDKATRSPIKKKLLVIKPQPLTFSKNSSWIKRKRTSNNSLYTTTKHGKPSPEKKVADNEMLTTSTKLLPEFVHGGEEAAAAPSGWWESILFGHDGEMLEQERAADKYSNNCHMTTMDESKEDEQNADLWVSAINSSSMESKNIVEDVECSDLDHLLFLDENLWGLFGVPD